jgi:hypothetical protein
LAGVRGQSWLMPPGLANSSRSVCTGKCRISAGLAAGAESCGIGGLSRRSLLRAACRAMTCWAYISPAARAYAISWPAQPGRRTVVVMTASRPPGAECPLAGRPRQAGICAGGTGRGGRPAAWHRAGGDHGACGNAGAVRLAAHSSLRPVLTPGAADVAVPGPAARPLGTAGRLGSRLADGDQDLAGEQVPAGSPGARPPARVPTSSACPGILT